MTFLRHPLLLAALALASCWWAYDFGKQSVEQESPKAESLEIQLSSKESVQSDRDRSSSLRQQLNQCVSVEDFRGALDQLQFQADKTEENRLLSLFFQRWLEVSPLDALSEVRRVESLRHDIVRTAGVFELWARENPKEALLLLQQVLDGRQSEVSSRPPFLDGVDPPEYLLSLISGLAKADPQSSADLLKNATSSLIQGDALDVLFQNWFPENSEKVFQWARSLEDSAFRESVIAKVGAKAGQLDPSSGIVWAQSLATPIDQKRALSSLTRQWAQRHSRDAFQWVKEQAGDLKFELIPPVISALTKVDPGAAADWLDQFEASPKIDPSVAAYALSISAVNPAAALGTAEVITNQEQRESVTKRILRDWEANAPESFRLYREGKD